MNETDAPVSNKAVVCTPSIKIFAMLALPTKPSGKVVHLA